MNEAPLLSPVPETAASPPVEKTRGIPFWWVPVLLMVVLLAATLTPIFFWGFDVPGWNRAHLAADGVLLERMKDVSGEVSALRHHMMHQVEEDIIMLKVLFLNRKVSPSFARKVARIVHKNARHYRKDPDFILSLIKVESNFNPRAKSDVGATGLMQVMPQWKDQLGIRGDLTDPATSVKYGLQILGFYEQMYAKLETALMAYNRGPGMVDTDLMRGKDPTRNGFSRKVLDVYATLKKLAETAKEK